MPPEYFKKPLLYPDLQGTVEMFFELSPSRQIGFSAGAIPISEIKAYFDLFGIDDYGVRRFFLKRVRLMDNIYLDLINKNKSNKTSKHNSTLVNSRGEKLSGR
jgi:hypothetical protein